MVSRNTLPQHKNEAFGTIMKEKDKQYHMEDAQTHCLEVSDYRESPPIVCLSIAITVINRVVEIYYT